MKIDLDKRYPFELVDHESSWLPFNITFLFFLGLSIGVLTSIAVVFLLSKNTPYVSPIPDNIVTIPIATPSATLVPTPVVMKWNGTASYYSREGCLGCSPTLTMANGETLDDSRYTLAMTPKDVRAYKLLNTKVTVKNVQTNASIVATVTDTGGFARYSRIADLSVATKQAIGCKDLCEVEITPVD